MLCEVARTIEKHGMILPGERVVVGVSGGADSIALLHVLKELRRRFSFILYAAHVNHGIRGRDADEDADFVARTCAKWQIPFYLKKFNVKKLAREWGMSEEEAGRKVRYDFFENVLKMIGGHKIALAHHRDDQAETILHNILRGTGLHGLQGMKPVREGKFIRPLLYISREQIIEYCCRKGLAYRIDATNSDVSYTRNRIRHVLIPYIKENFNPAFTETLVRMGEIARDEDEFISDCCRTLFRRHAIVNDREVRIPLEEFLHYPRAIKRRVLRMGIEILLGGIKDLGAIHVESVLHMCVDSPVGSTVSLPRGLIAKKDYEFIVLTSNIQKPVKTECFEYVLPVPGEVYVKETGIKICARRLMKRDEMIFEPCKAYINGDAVQGVLRVRNRREGDRFKPLGMKGTKKLKDYFIDRKVPRSKRDEILLVVDDKNIIWVAGYQIHEDYKVTGQTNNIIELKISDKI